MHRRDGGYDGERMLKLELPVSRNVEMCENDIYQIKNWRIEK